MKKEWFHPRNATVLALMGSFVLLASSMATASPTEGPRWHIEANSRSAQRLLHVEQTMRVRNGLTMILVDGVPIGAARLASDLRSVSTPLPQGFTIRPDSKISLSEPSPRASTGPGSAQASAESGSASQVSPARSPSALTLPVDPATPGRYAVDTIDYDLGAEAIEMPLFSGLTAHSEMSARIYLPRANDRPSAPLVLFMHGRHSVCHLEGAPGPFQWPCPAPSQSIPSYLGYQEAAQALASHGYVVVSVSANGVNAADQDTLDFGMAARATVLKRHLDYLNQANLDGTHELGERLKGRMDFSRIGLMGHSRGGEAVIAAALDNAQQGKPYGIKAILALAPTNFHRWALPEAPLAVVLPYCDGDVSDLTGQHYIDDSRHAFADSALRTALIVHGANHNFFNTVWTPGLGPDAIDDADWSMGSACHSPSYRLTDTEQRAVGTAYIAGFFRATLANEQSFLPLYDGSNVRAASTGRAKITSVAIAPASQRVDIDTFENANPLLSYRGGQAEICDSVEPGFVDIGNNNPRCAIYKSSQELPHWTYADLDPTRPASPMLRMHWPSPGGVLELRMPGGSVDGSAFSYLSFRVMPLQGHAPLRSLDIYVTLIDRADRRATIRLSQFSDALKPLPDANAAGGKLLLQGVRIPLPSFTNIDKTAIARIELQPTSFSDGGIYLSDMALVNSGVH